MMPRGRARFCGHDNDDALCMLGHMYVHACRKWGKRLQQAICRVSHHICLLSSSLYQAKIYCLLHTLQWGSDMSTSVSTSLCVYLIRTLIRMHGPSQIVMTIDLISQSMYTLQRAMLLSLDADANTRVRASKQTSLMPALWYFSTARGLLLP
jgi:hypothetical protein